MAKAGWFGSITDKNPVVFWDFNGYHACYNGSHIEVSYAEDVTEVQKLGGRTMRIHTLYGATSPRTFGLATIKVTYPRVSAAFFEVLRRYREFGDAFTIEVSVFDPDSPVLCVRGKDSLGLPRRFWSPNNWLKEDSSLVLYTKSSGGVLTVASANDYGADTEHGFVDWLSNVPDDTDIYISYKWAPRVRVMEMTPGDVPGTSFCVYKPQIVLHEVDPNQEPLI